MEQAIDLSVVVALARHKVEWAKEHIRHLEKVISAALSENDYIVRVENNSEAGRYFFEIGPKETGIPLAVPLYLGDAIHNLNSVTDYLWSGLARHVDPDIATKITFPRDETRENLENRLADAKGFNAAIKRTLKDIDAFVLDEVKPYRATDGASSFIWALNKLDNINKHRFLIASTNIIAFRKDFIARSDDGSIQVIPAGIKIQTNGSSFTGGFTSPFKLDHDPEPTLSIVLNEVDIIGREPVLETAVNLTNAVEEVIRTFEQTFVSGRV